MSIVGTRPPTLDEWNKYELHHRARLAIKPGMASMFTLYNSEMSQREIILKLTLYSGYVTLTIYISGKQFFNHSVI